MADPVRRLETDRLRERAALVLRLERDSLANFALATCLAAPLSLLATNGSAFVIGLAYAVAYVLLMLLPTALFIVMGYDALRIGLQRRAIFMPYLWALAKLSPEPTLAHKQTRMTSVLALGIVGNPLSTLIRELWLFALRFNRHAMNQLDQDADRLVKQMLPMGITGHLIAREVRSIPERQREIDLVAIC